MKLIEIFKAQGLNDEVITKITNDMKENKIYETSLENADVRYEKLQEQKKQYEESSKNLEKQLKELSKNNKDNEELKKQLEQLQLSNKELEDNHSKEMNELQFNHALDGALSTAKCKNNKALKALLDMSNIKYQDGKLEGLEGQIEGLKKEASYLFDGEQQTPLGSGFNPGGSNSKTFTVEEVKKMSASEINANWEHIKDMQI